MNLTPEQRKVGESNFQNVAEFTRRDFIKGGLTAAAVAAGGVGYMYYGYEKELGDPLRVGFIGTGDEGGVLIGALNPKYLKVVAIADIRPFSVWRAFHGDNTREETIKARAGLMRKYDWKSEDEARRNVRVYAEDYRELLADPNVEAVVIALPLHLHAPVAIEALKAGKHVLTEKLMGHSVHECKEMGRVAKKKDLLLVTGHQRHYSILYDDAVNTIRQGLIGDIHSIRAQWHRGNLPGKDSWTPKLPSDPGLAKDIENLQKQLAAAISDKDHTALEKRIAQIQAQCEDAKLNAESYGYQGGTLPTGYKYSPMEELVRWRLWNRTGGGLMAELGSHQLDASGIYISAMNPHGEKALPLNVAAVGGRYIFPNDRECEDHVYCTYEFPGKNYETNKDSKVGVVYSSINGNQFGGYGEVVMGTKGTLILEGEQVAMLFAENTSTNVKVTKDEKKGPVLTTTESGAVVAAGGPISKGYTEEMEHWAYCIRHRDPANIPRCHPKIALGDAVIALTTNIAIRDKKPMEFNKDWFDIDSDETPEGVKPDLSKYGI